MATDAHEEVVGLDVAMNEVLHVHILDATDHLIGQHQHGLHCESETRAFIEKNDKESCSHRREQKLNKSSSEGPSKSMTRTLYSRSVPYQLQIDDMCYCVASKTKEGLTECVECRRRPAVSCTLCSRTTAADDERASARV